MPVCTVSHGITEPLKGHDGRRNMGWEKNIYFNAFVLPLKSSVFSRETFRSLAKNSKVLRVSWGNAKHLQENTKVLTYHFFIFHHHIPLVSPYMKNVPFG